MATHGGLVPLRGVVTEADDRDEMQMPGSGYRHFIRTPGPAERFRLFGRLPRECPDVTDDLLRRLSERLIFGKIWDTPLRSGAPAWENPDIPAGYTYLAQLVAHDLVQTSAAFPTVTERAGVLRNHRTFDLDLDTLYGAGPAHCPHAYAIERHDGFRSRLRLGRMRQSSERIGAPLPPFRDIDRGFAHQGNDVPREGATEPLLADSRNDDNSNLSQLTTIFIHLHNAVLERIENSTHAAHAQSAEVRNELQFSLARRIVTDVYRRIVRFDLLPKVVDRRVLTLYESEGVGHVDGVDDGRMPLEFSHGAYRFGHAMVRPEYTLNPTHSFAINQVMRTTSSREPWNMPLNERWIVQWSRFFELGDREVVNYSHRIGPKFAHKLLLPVGLGYPEDGTPKNLAHRDLLRSASTLWSVPALISEIKRRQPAIVALSRILSDYDATSLRIRDWLRRNGGGLITGDEISELAANPPLLFFILFEAAEENGGRHLGVLGSVIVAETLLKLHSRWRETAPDTLMELLGTAELSTMPALLRTIAEHGGLEDASPPFL